MFSCHGVEGPAGLIRSTKPEPGAIPSAEGIPGEGSVCPCPLAGGRRHGQVRWMAKDALLQRGSELFSGTTWRRPTVSFISDT